MLPRIPLTHPFLSALDPPFRAYTRKSLGWFPDRDFTLVADGAYACKEMALGGLPDRARFVGRMRGDAAVYDPKVPRQRKGKRGRKPTKGPRPKREKVAKEADKEADAA